MTQKPPKKKLDKSDAELWSNVISDITPLGERPSVEPPPLKRPIIRKRSTDILPDDRIVFGGAGESRGPAQTHIPKRDVRRLVTGEKSIDSTIDLHGMGREEAYRLLCSQIPRSFSLGHKMVLVITGKGGARFQQIGSVPVALRKRKDFELDEGILRGALSGWLSGSDLNDYVAGFTPASEKHGGKGAFYVRLRTHKGGRK